MNKGINSLKDLKWRIAGSDFHFKKIILTVMEGDLWPRGVQAGVRAGRAAGRLLQWVMWGGRWAGPGDWPRRWESSRRQPGQTWRGRLCQR